MLATQVSYWQIQEAKRHNLATEKQAKEELAEAKRHNVAGEDETRRHNVVWETENQRHNIASETETKRHNLATENVEYGKLAESKRHNIATENIDWARTNESRRHNQADEAIRRQSNRINAWKASNDYTLGLRAAEQRDTELGQKSIELDIKRDQTKNDFIKAKAAQKQADVAKWKVITGTFNDAWRNANSTLDTIWRNANDTIGTILRKAKDKN